MKLDVICLSETRLNINNINCVNLPGYNLYFNNSLTSAGGAAMFVSENLECTENRALCMNVENCEDVWVDISLSHRNNCSLTIGSVYRHPRNNVDEFSEAFASKISSFTNNKKYVILGDFNIDYTKYNSNNKIKHYADEITSLGCDQLIVVPTRITTHSQSILDHIYVNDSILRDIHSSAVIEYDISDHMSTFLSLNVGATKKAPNRPLVRKITEIKRDVFLNELNQKLRYLDMQNNLDFEKLINVMKELVDSYFPLVRQFRKQLKYSHKPWITKGILTSIKTQNRLYEKYLKSKCETNCKTYKMYRNKLTHIKEMSKSNYYQRRLGESGDMSDTWKTINNILRKPSESSTLPTYVKYESKPIYGQNDVCNAMNNHFCSIGHKLSKRFANSSCHDKSDKTFFDQRVSSSIFLEPTDQYEINAIIDKLNAYKPPGMVNIPTRLIKDAKYILSPHLSRVINSCLSSGKYPDSIKVARVTPIHKGGPKYELSNYRPISILSPFNKILETVIKSRLIKFWDKLNVFSPTQFGFRTNYSTSLAITQVHECILRKLDDRQTVCGIFMDLAKAFDTVDHNVLLF